MYLFRNSPSPPFWKFENSYVTRARSNLSRFPANTICHARMSHHAKITEPMKLSTKFSVVCLKILKNPKYKYKGEKYKNICIFNWLYTGIIYRFPVFLASTSEEQGFHILIQNFGHGPWWAKANRFCSHFYEKAHIFSFICHNVFIISLKMIIR